MPDSGSDFDWSTLFGDSLLSHRRGGGGGGGEGGYEVPTNDALNGKAVGIYFSGKWCPPCRQFTPLFSSYYSGRKLESGKGVGGGMKRDLEVVFVSSDQSLAEFNAYFGEMPWLAVPFGKQQVIQTLSKKYSVSGIPCLILLHPDGSIDTLEGRNRIMKEMGMSSAGGGGITMQKLLIFVIVAIFIYNAFYSRP